MNASLFLFTRKGSVHHGLSKRFKALIQGKIISVGVLYTLVFYSTLILTAFIVRLIRSVCRDEQTKAVTEVFTEM